MSHSSLMRAIFVGTLIVSGHTFAAGAPSLTQTVAGGGVTTQVTYLNPKSDEEPRFELVLDTHSVNLDAHDLKTIAVLSDDTGKSYTLIGVEAKGAGHHRKATLAFSKLAPEAKRIKLLIKNLAGVKERTFQWELQ